MEYLSGAATTKAARQNNMNQKLILVLILTNWVWIQFEQLQFFQKLGVNFNLTDWLNKFN